MDDRCNADIESETLKLRSGAPFATERQISVFEGRVFPRAAAAAANRSITLVTDPRGSDTPHHGLRGAIC
jgi:hypothetical protein